MIPGREPASADFGYGEVRSAVGTSGARIVDYADSDFRLFFDRSSNRILHELEARIVADNVGHCAGWFLDLGAGYGRLAPYYSGDKRQRVLVDYATKNLAIAAKTLRGKDTHFIGADAYNLPFRTGVFQGGVCVRMFHHVESPDLFFPEFRRVFDNQARIVFTYVNPRSLMRVARHGLSNGLRVAHRRLSWAVYGTHPRFFDRMAHENGFRCRGVAGLGLLHQVDSATNLVEGIVNKRPYLIPSLTWLEAVSSRILGPLRLSFLQYVVLCAKKCPETVKSLDPSVRLEEILRCPQCRHDGLTISRVGVGCPSCRRVYRRIGRVLDLRA